LWWLAIIAAASLGFVSILGSLIAIQSRRTAGIIFLAVMPVSVFCVAYLGLVSWNEGSSVYRLPLLIVGWLIPFLLPGLFWLRTSAWGWPSLLQPRPRSLAKRVPALVVTGTGVLFLIVVFTMVLAGLRSGFLSPNCRGTPLFAHPLYPDHAVFTAKILFAGRSIQAMTRKGGTFGAGVSDTIGYHDLGDWAIGVVEERFWGMPYWTRLVVLTNHYYWKGETYFVDGRRDRGLLTQFLPVVEGGEACARTRPVQHAIVELRQLRNPPLEGSTRLTGHVRGPVVYDWIFHRPVQPTFQSGVEIEVASTSGTRKIVTDSDGVFQTDDLAPGDYTLTLSPPKNQIAGRSDREALPAAIRVKRGEIAERNFDVMWEGRIP
jgi:hypothetical protein